MQTMTTATARPVSDVGTSVPPAAVSSTGPADAARLGAWFGLSTGLAEVVLLAVKKFYLQAYIHRDSHFVWQAPLTYVVCGAGLGVVLGGAAWLAPRWVTRRAVTFLFAFLGWWTLLQMTEKIGPFAKLLLAAGLARITAQWMTTQPGRLNGLMVHTFAWPTGVRRLAGKSNRSPAEPTRRDLLVGTGAMAAGLVAGAKVWEASLKSPIRLAPGMPAAPGAPNVLLVVLDTVRAQSLSLYGYRRPTTPNLERLARIGIRFDRALATAGWTLPSHAGMFTGRYPTELSCDWTVPLDATHPTLAEVLAERGYATAGFVANNYYCSRESGLARGFEHYEDFRLTPGQIVLSNSLGDSLREPLNEYFGNHHNLGRKSSRRLTADFLSWHASRERGRPFFAFLNYFDAHEHYYVPPEFAHAYRPTTPEGFLDAHRAYSPHEVQELNDAYDSAITSLDHQLGVLFAELERDGTLSNTFVVVVADHGEQFGEHDLLSHGNSLYLPLIHVPLVIVPPVRGLASRAVTEPVSLRDVPATVMDYLGLTDRHGFPGRSLLTHVADRPSASASVEYIYSASRFCHGPTTTGVPIHRHMLQSLVSEGLHYIKDGNGREELYAYATDPLEQHDVAGTDQGRRAVERFRNALRRVSSPAPVPGATADPTRRP